VGRALAQKRIIVAASQSARTMWRHFARIILIFDDKSGEMCGARAHLRSLPLRWRFIIVHASMLCCETTASHDGASGPFVLINTGTPMSIPVAGV
jgi:hypothetical protein